MIESSRREYFYRQEYYGCVYSLCDTYSHRREPGGERVQIAEVFYGDRAKDA